MTPQDRCTAACAACGRGYLWIAREGARCFECGGALWSLPTPEPVTLDLSNERERRKALVCGRTIYVAWSRDLGFYSSSEGPYVRRQDYDALVSALERSTPDARE